MFLTPFELQNSAKIPTIGLVSGGFNTEEGKRKFGKMITTGKTEIGM